MRSGTKGADRLMHKQERGGINELLSYCTQGWPPTGERKKRRRRRGSAVKATADSAGDWRARGRAERRVNVMQNKRLLKEESEGQVTKKPLKALTHPGYMTIQKKSDKYSSKTGFSSWKFSVTMTFSHHCTHCLRQFFFFLVVFLQLQSSKVEREKRGEVKLKRAIESELEGGKK